MKIVSQRYPCSSEPENLCSLREICYKIRALVILKLTQQVFVCFLHLWNRAELGQKLQVVARCLQCWMYVTQGRLWQKENWPWGNFPPTNPVKLCDVFQRKHERAWNMPSVSESRVHGWCEMRVMQTGISGVWNSSTKWEKIGGRECPQWCVFCISVICSSFCDQH